MAQCFKGWYMPERRDWNKMGPPLPAWFTLGLKEIDPRLVVQFVPPLSKDPKGCDPVRFPHGVWQICSRMTNSSRWLSKRAVYVLTDSLTGGQAKPTRALLKMLRASVAATRKKQSLEEQFLRSLQALNRADSMRSREKLLDRIVQTMRKRNMSGAAKPRVFYPSTCGVS